MKRILISLLLFLALGVSIVLAQQPSASPTQPAQQQTTQKPDEEDVVRISTNLVQVDAVVTDKNGKIVTDLKPEELQIFEDGRQQKITHFSYNVIEPEKTASPEKKPTPADKTAPPPPSTRLRPEDVRRTIALVVDDLGLSWESTNFVRRALKKFVDEQMQPGDLVAIVRTSGGMGALQSFTSDKRQLYAAIDRVKYYMNGRGGISAFAPIEPPTPGRQGPEIDQANEELNQFREDVYAVGTLGAVSYVVRGLRDLPGRKSILLISDGFRIYSQDDSSRNYRTLQKLQRLIDEAGRASVVIYTMNATGLQAFALTAADNLNSADGTAARSAEDVEDQLGKRRNAAFETQEGLDYLARETGGIPIRNTNDLSGGIRRVLEDQRGYYLIGYRPEAATFDPRTGRRSFHHITLKVKRPGKFNVRMRHGFFGVSDEERAKPRTLGQQMIGALVSPFGATGVHLQLTSLFANDPKMGSIMRSLLQIDARDLTFTNEADGTHKSVFDLLAITFGDNGVAIDSVGRTYTLQLPDNEYKRVLREGIVYYVTVPLKKPGAYQLRMSLRDTATERIGSASQFIDAPDIKKNRMAVSGIVLRGETRGTAAAVTPTAGNEGLQQGDPEASPAVRRLSRGMVLSYGYFIYNARLDKTSNRPQLTTQVRLFRDGKQVFSGSQSPYATGQQADLKRLPVSGGIQLGSDMTPGDYVLQVVVTDLLADEKQRITTQSIDFQIVK